MQLRTTSWAVVVILALAVCLLAPASSASTPVGTSFTYQGILAYGTGPASGAFDLRFILYDADVGGSQVGPLVVIEDLAVTEGRVVTTLDFGAVFTGNALWLEVAVREGASTGGYTTLSPRQPLSAAPYAQRAASAATATTATTATSAGYATSAGSAAQLDGQTASYYLAWANLTGVPTGLADGDDDSLGELACADGDVVRWSGGAWTCGADAGELATTYVVGPVGDAAANGTALRQAMVNLPPASQTAPLLVQVEPGLYDLGSSELMLPQWVDLEGSGRGTTTITSAICSALDSDGTLDARGYSGVRDLSVVNTCAGASGYGTAIRTGPGVELRSVDATSAGNAPSNYAVWCQTGSSRLLDVRAEVLAGSDAGSVYGVRFSGVDLDLRNVRVDVAGDISWNYGIYASGTGSASFQDVRVSLATSASNPTGLLLVTWSEVAVRNLTLEVSTSGIGAAGVSVISNGVLGRARFVDSVIAVDGVSAFGLETNGVGAVTLDGVDVVALGPGSGVSIFNPEDGADATLRVTDCDISGGTNGIRLQRGGTGLVSATIRASTIHGDRSVSGATNTEVVKVGGSCLSGGPVDYIVATCAGVWDENFTFYASTCP